MKKFYYTYVLKSNKDNQLYIGFTKDLNKRLKKHLEGNVESTRNRLPLKLVYYEACLNKRLAVKREKQLKTGFDRAYLKRRLKGIV